MVKALHPVMTNHPELKIVCTGPVFSKEEKICFLSNKLEDRIVHVKPSDEELRNLYSHAVCFIYPSLYEGFGIPILEAWQSDCPVLLNKRSCFPEIAQDAAVFFNLDENQYDLAIVMENFLKMGDYEKKELFARQKRRLADFTWKKSAEQLVNIYKNILQKEI